MHITILKNKENKKENALRVVKLVFQNHNNYFKGKSQKSVIPQ